MCLEYRLCAWVPTMCIGLCYCFVYAFSFSSQASSMKRLQITFFLGERKWYFRTLNFFFLEASSNDWRWDSNTALLNCDVTVTNKQRTWKIRGLEVLLLISLLCRFFNCVPTTVAVALVVLGNLMLLEVEIILFWNFAFKVRVREDGFRVDAK